MTQSELFGQDHAEDTDVRETTTPVAPLVDRVREDDLECGEPLHLFVGLEELYSPTGWGDLQRMVNFRFADVRLVDGPDRTWLLLLRNPVTGMWRMQGNPDFLSLAAATLAAANAEALRLAEDRDIVSEKLVRRFQRYLEKTGGGSVTRTLREASRLAEDPTVPVARVDTISLNPVSELPVLLAGAEIISLTDGAVMSPCDLLDHYLLDLTPGPTSYVPDAMHREALGAVMMRAFLQYLGNGDAEILTRRLGWQLCGSHATLDVIAGDHGALRWLARALRETLGSSGLHILSMERGQIRARDVAHGIEESRLCVWPGADTRRRFPVWEVNDLISQVNCFRQGNMVVLVADWPEDWDALDHRVAGTFGWAWRVHGLLADQGIDVDAMLDQDGREYLLAALISGAVQSHAQFQAGIGSRSDGDPGRVAVTEYSLACAEELKLAGSSPVHRVLYQALRFTGDANDRMTMADIDDAVTAIGADPVDHAVVGRALRVMWPGVESGRDRINGTQTRVVRRVAPRPEARV